MKKCSKCSIPQENSEFFFKNKNRGTLHSICKTCKRNLDNQAYSENRNNRKEKVRIIAKKNQDWAREFISRVRKKCKCSRCNDPRWYVIDFHHKDGKDYNICEMNSCSIFLIKKELRKCIPLCSNCHRELHYFNNLDKKLTR